MDSFGFEYEFKSATELYTSGAYDDALLNALKKYDDIPTLKADLEKILGCKKNEQPEKKQRFNLEKLLTKKNEN